MQTGKTKRVGSPMFWLDSVDVQEVVRGALRGASAAFLASLYLTATTDPQVAQFAEGAASAVLDKSDVFAPAIVAAFLAAVQLVERFLQDNSIELPPSNGP